ncbi:MAG TPA: right-handed parallel beta-helix repeat-containing protein, partial [Polyangiales bacterium]|nr:right-handed parallel beta-helix repeat-containing protein [Polyangiales bacterium]
DPDAGSDAGNDAGTELHVEPLSTLAPNWNDYAGAGDPELDVCYGAQLYNFCSNGGLLRKVALPGVTDCTGITAADDEQWFEWSCEKRGSEVRVRTRVDSWATPRSSLVDFIDMSNPNAPQWKANRVTVKQNGVTLLTTAQEPWWTNPFHVVPQAASSGVDQLDEQGAVYVITSTPIHELQITAHSVSLVAIGPSLIGTTGSSTGPVISTTPGLQYLWLEGLNLDASQHSGALQADINYSQVLGVHASRSASETGTGADISLQADASYVRDLQSVNARDVGIWFQGYNGPLDDVHVSDAGGDCIQLVPLGEPLTDVSAENCGGAGVTGDGTLASLTHARIAHTGGDGLLLTRLHNTRLRDLIVADCGARGVTIAEQQGTSYVSDDVTLDDVFISNCTGDGVVLRGRNHRVSGVHSVGNGGDGVHLEAQSSIVMNVSVLQNLGDGVHVTGGATHNWILNTVTVNNVRGLALEAGADHNDVKELFASDNDQGLWLGADDVLFHGTIALGGATGCTLDAAVTHPGLTDTPQCDNAGGSDATWPANAVANQAFVGRATQGDTKNTSDDAQGRASYANVSDWLTFDNHFRHWAKDGTFPQTALRGPCRSGDTCSIWDWRVRTASALTDRLGANPYNELAVQSHVLTHTWLAVSQTSCANDFNGSTWDDTTGVCRVTFLDYGFHDGDGGYGNTRDNLCQVRDPGQESLEYCEVTRNRGAYPGEGGFDVPNNGNGVAVGSAGSFLPYFLSLDAP